MRPVENVNGKYGIESLKATTDAANKAFDLFEKIYLDDRKWSPDDWIDLIGNGPGVAQAIVKAANKGSELGREITDLSEIEKAELEAIFGDRVNKPGFQKIFAGILNIVDGVSELRNPDNPTG